MKPTWIAFLLVSSFTILTAPRASAGMFSKNTVEDVFTVKSLTATEAVLEGEPKTLKAGDLLYFVRSPFKFTITSVKGSEVKIALPDKHDLKVGNTLMRNENDQIRSAIDTEKRLKQALDE